MKSSLIILTLILSSFTKPGTDPGYKIGDTVDDFSLKSVSGGQVSLSDYSDQKGVILIFDCNTCPVSRMYNERIRDLHAKFSSQGFPVVAINANDPEKSPGDSFERMKEYAREKEYQHAYLQDTDQRIARAFGATNTPHVFVLNNVNGAFIVSYIGAIDNNARDGDMADKKYVEDAVNALLHGQEPAVKSTRSIGCTIKWKNT